MTATHGLGTYGDAVGTVTPLDHKMAQLGLIAKTAANTIRAGLFWDGNATVVSGKPNMSYDVRALSAVTSRGATSGAVLLTNDAVVNVVTTAAPGSNSRYDVVYIWQREYSLDGTDSNPVIGVVQGSAAASPSVPSLAAFPGAIELARILVPAGVTATNSGTTITQTAPFTATAGGLIPFRNSTEMGAGSYVETQLGWLLDSQTPVQFDGTNWRVLTGMVPLVPGSVSGSGVTVSLTGLVSFTTATTVTVDAVFSSLFRSYLIEFESSGTAASLLFNLRTSAPADVSTGYDSTSDLSRNGTTASATTPGGTSWILTGFANTLLMGELIIAGPALPQPTKALFRGGAHSNPAVQNAANGVVSQYLTHQASTAYAGLKLTFSASQTGTVRIYGKP